MKKEKDRHLGLRIDSESLEKLHSIADYEGRSCNGQIVYLIRKCISEFEAKNGQIELPSEDHK